MHCRHHVSSILHPVARCNRRRGWSRDLGLGDVGSGGPLVVSHNVVDDISVGILVALLVVQLDSKLLRIIVGLENVGSQTASLGNGVFLEVEGLSMLPFCVSAAEAVDLAEGELVVLDVVKSNLRAELANDVLWGTRYLPEARRGKSLHAGMRQRR
jgi:hypothetical protein